MPTETTYHLIHIPDPIGQVHGQLRIVRVFRAFEFSCERNVMCTALDFSRARALDFSRARDETIENARTMY